MAGSIGQTITTLNALLNKRKVKSLKHHFTRTKLQLNESDKYHEVLKKTAKYLQEVKHKDKTNVFSLVLVNDRLYNKSWYKDNKGITRNYIIPIIAMHNRTKKFVAIAIGKNAAERNRAKQALRNWGLKNDSIGADYKLLICWGSKNEEPLFLGDIEVIGVAEKQQGKPQHKPIKKKVFKNIQEELKYQQKALQYRVYDLCKKNHVYVKRLDTATERVVATMPNGIDKKVFLDWQDCFNWILEADRNKELLCSNNPILADVKEQDDNANAVIKRPQRRAI